MIRRADIDPDRVMSGKQMTRLLIERDGRVNSLELRAGGITGNPSERINELIEDGLPIRRAGHVEFNGQRSKLYVLDRANAGVGTGPTAAPSASSSAGDAPSPAKEGHNHPREETAGPDPGVQPEAKATPQAKASGSARVILLRDYTDPRTDWELIDEPEWMRRAA